MTIKFGYNYYSVEPAPVYEGELAFKKANPNATIAERVAEKNRLRQEQKDRIEALKAKGYPAERRFQYEETANRYAREIERECGFKPSVIKAFDAAF